MPDTRTHTHAHTHSHTHTHTHTQTREVGECQEKLAEAEHARDVAMKQVDAFTLQV